MARTLTRALTALQIMLLLGLLIICYTAMFNVSRLGPYYQLLCLFEATLFLQLAKEFGAHSQSIKKYRQSGKEGISVNDSKMHYEK